MKYKDINLPAYTDEDRKNIRYKLTDALNSFPGKVIALDDDPTGVQTIHDIHVYTDWSEKSIEGGFLSQEKLFFLLTNSRAFTEEKTKKVHTEIAKRIAKISKKTGIPFLLISRGDSTLRGHYPLETDTLRDTLEKELSITFDGEILCPYFREGGRFTIDDIHYVKQGGDLIPCSETEFAKDAAFGYHASNLKAYIEEKTKGKYPADKAVSIPLSLLREQKYEEITDILLHLNKHTRMIINAVEDEDIMVFVTAMYRAMQKGKHFLIRSAAAFVKASAAVTDKELLKHADMISEDSQKGGLIIIGSHTAKTTAQLRELMKIKEISFLACNSDLVLKPEEFKTEIETLTRKTDELLNKGITVCVYTNRKELVVAGDTKKQSLLRSVSISDALVSLARNLKTKPSFVVAKGGITSSDIGVKALQVRKALVMGQIQPGVPVWKTDPDCRFPDIPYIIFPGNVGNTDTLYQAASILLNR